MDSHPTHGTLNFYYNSKLEGCVRREFPFYVIPFDNRRARVEGARTSINTCRGREPPS
jgi:hypothetical protein